MVLYDLNTENDCSQPGTAVAALQDGEIDTSRTNEGTSEILVSLSNLLWKTFYKVMIPTAALYLGWTTLSSLSLFVEARTQNKFCFQWLSFFRWRRPSYPVMITATLLATPAVAMLQGALALLRFRLCFGDAPAPLTPSHGVVVAITKPTLSQSTRTAPQRVTDSPCSPTKLDSVLQEILTRPPLRLLVIGDSLANGIGQAESCTPIMPEVIAKSLSRSLGCVVYWTCHGSPGASTARIVRELDQGVDYYQPNCTDGGTLEKRESDNELILNLDECGDNDEIDKAPAGSCSETEESSLDDSVTGELRKPLPSSSTPGPYFPPLTTQYGKPASKNTHMNKCNKSTVSMSVWRRRLAQHKKRFNPDRLGPYDIVIVLTGSNDLKAAFFPFLLSGDEVEFRRQAKERGGSYSQELLLLMDTINNKTRLQFESLRDSVIEKVEAATETMRGKVEETMELLSPGSSNRVHFLRHSSRSRDLTNAVSEESVRSLESNDRETVDVLARQAPLVVLPGLPSRSLPIFQNMPLRWFIGPIVDHLDKHKRKLAKAHPGDVLFVKAPTKHDLARFEVQEGELWDEKMSEDTILCLSDVSKRERKRVEQQMQDYYAPRGESVAALAVTSSQPNAIKLGGMSPFSNFFSRATLPSPGSSIFAADRVHPNDKGYDFWGRYIAQSISDDWLKHRSSHCPAR